MEAQDALKDGKGGAKNQKALQKKVEEIEQELEEEKVVEICQCGELWFMMKVSGISEWEGNGN